MPCKASIKSLRLLIVHYLAETVHKYAKVRIVNKDQHENV